MNIILLTRLRAWARAKAAEMVAAICSARQRLIRKSIWKRRKPRPQTRNEFLAQLSRITIDRDCTFGIASLDSHHKMISILFNGLVNEAAWSGQSKAGMHLILHRLSILISAISEHFINEEAVMKTYSYPQELNYKLQHDGFLVDILELMECIETEDYGVEEFLFFVGSWWSGHILISDKRLSEFLSAQASS